MRAVTFKSEAALRVALESGLVPAEIGAAPAVVAHHAGGAVTIATEVKWPLASREPLSAAGVEVESATPRDATEIRCWAEAVRVRRVAEPPEIDRALFLTEGDGGLLDLSAELLRLGCDRQELAVLDGPEGRVGLIRATAPPYYSLLRAQERRGLKAFLLTRRERIWVELGFAHPLVEKVRAPDKSLLLVPGEGPWRTLPDGPWRDVYDALELLLPAGGVTHRGAELPAKRKVMLRLAHAARRAAPTLWVLRERAVEQIDQLLAQAPEELAERLTFAVAKGDRGPVVVLRARPGRQGPPELAFDAEAHAPLPQLPQLFVPIGAAVEPPLRRDRLRALLCPESEKVTWLSPLPGGSFRPESLPDSAFAPLSDWVDYLVSEAASTLEPWVRAATFDFASFEALSGEWGELESRHAEHAPEKRERPRRTEKEVPVAAPVKKTRPAAAVTIEEPAPAIATRKTLPATGAAAALTAMEKHFLSLDTPADDPERHGLWVTIAELQGQLGNLREAGLAWTRALWEHPEDRDLAARWIAAERPPKPAAAAAALEELLALATPSRDQVRSAAALVCSGELPAAALHDAARWLEERDGVLDVRSTWLASLASAQQSGGDPLALARARDRVLSRLARGLSVARDVPAFLRFPAADGARATGGAAQLGEELDALLIALLTAPRKRDPLEAPLPQTKAYLQAIVAWGHARLGRSERALELQAKVAVDLDLKDPVHAALVALYGGRLEQALEGLPGDTPLAAAISSRVNALDKLGRYKVDRLRQGSAILEPTERLDPIRGFVRDERDARGEEFATLRTEANPVKLADDVARLFAVAQAAGTAPAERARLFGGLMDFFPFLPESRVAPMLATLIEQIDKLPVAHRSSLYEEALAVAGLLGDANQARALATKLEPLLRKLGAEQAAAAGRSLAGCLRPLRRLGLREEGARLLSAVADAAGGEGVPALLVRLGVAGGLHHLGRGEEAEIALTSAERALAAKSKIRLPERLEIIRAYALALGHAPLEVVLPRHAFLKEQLPQITDGYAATSSHFCVSLLHYAESLVLALVSEDLALSDFGRRFLDEDEHLVRRRIHRDLAAATRPRSTR